MTSSLLESKSTRWTPDLTVLVKLTYWPLEDVAVILTHCGLVTPYGDMDLCRHWFRLWLVAWWHQAITWTNVDWSSVKSSDIHIRAISLEMPNAFGNYISTISFKFPRGQWIKRIIFKLILQNITWGTCHPSSCQWPSLDQIMAYHHFAAKPLPQPLMTIFTDISIKICWISVKVMFLKISRWKYWPFYLSLDLLMTFLARFSPPCLQRSVPNSVGEALSSTRQKEDWLPVQP